MRLNRFLGECRFSRTRHCCHWQLRRPEFPSADHCSVGRDAPPLGLLTARYTAKSRQKAGIDLSGVVPANYQVCPRPLWPLDLMRSADRVPSKKTHFFAWHITGFPDRKPPPFPTNVVITLFLQSIAECADATSRVYRDGAFSLTREPRAAVSALG